MLKLMLITIFATTLPAEAKSADQDLSLSCQGATFDSVHEQGKKPKFFKPIHMEKTFHIRKGVLQPDMPCKVWTEDKIFCSNGDDMVASLFELCLAKSNNVTCLKIDRVTGDVFEQNKRIEGKKTTNSDFSGKCTKLTGQKF